MKALPHPLLRALMPLLLTFLVSGCAGLQQSMYESAIESEIDDAGLETHSIEIAEGRIALLRSRDGADQPTMVMVHGFGASNHNWLSLAEELQEDFYIIAPDLPGHGQSVQDPALSYRIPEQAQRLNAILDELGIDRAHLIGNSMGGAISAVFASDFPEHVRSLSLIDTAGIHKHPSKLDEMLGRGENPLIVKNSDDFDRLMDFVMEERPFIPWPISAVMARKAAANREINNKIFDDIRKDAHANFANILSTINVPTLVLWGREDRVIDVKNASLVADALPRPRLEVLEGIGHVPMIEVPEKTAQLIRGLTSQAGSPSQAQANTQ